MHRRRILSLISSIVATCFLAIGLKLFTPLPGTAQANNTLLISAAASLQDAMKDVGKLYQEKNRSSKIIYNFASSGTLQQQIEQGAPVDVFLSAAEKQINALEKKDLLLEGTRKNLLKNQVVLITPKNANTAQISGFKDLTSERVKRLSIGEPQSVPAGQYSREVLTSLNLYDQLKPKIVFAKDVRQVLTYVEAGNVDAGIVYATDAKVSDQVNVVTTAPENTHSPIIYPVAVIKQSKNPAAAKAFIQFLTSEPAKVVFKKYGFDIAQ